MEDKIYPLQKSQDKDLKKKFDNLHVEIVNKVIDFCKENNIQIFVPTYSCLRWDIYILYNNKTKQ